MFNIGCHISIAGGYKKAGEDALKVGGNTFQYFTRNPRGGSSKDLNSKDLQEFKKIYTENNFAPLFAHAPYTMNLSSDKEEVRAFAKNVLKEDLHKISKLPESYLIFHPGSHVSQGIEKGIQLIIDAVNEVITSENEIFILLEGMSGKGTEIGSSFEELKNIIDGIKNNKKVGVCLDTCHLYSAGYDIKDNLDGVLKEFDKIIGIEKLKGIHINDSKVPFASKKDRHEVLGEGTLGLETIVNIINHPLLKDLVFNLETPNELEGYKKEIDILKKRYRY
ncbi:MAG: deoxyribonuclease IV [Eubacteriales bacterium]|nr:deoxyribonuclease IV [Eubacteriales bacterium]